jgi:hypothetical protein
VAYTKGFRRERERIRHFALHGDDFGVAEESEYELMADSFIGGLKFQGVLECARKSPGEIIRFDPATNEFGVATYDLVILTYFKARPCASIPAGQPRVNCHGEKDNMSYFRRSVQSDLPMSCLWIQDGGSAERLQHLSMLWN